MTLECERCGLTVQVTPRLAVAVKSPMSMCCIQPMREVSEVSKPVWLEDDATKKDPDHETLEKATLRVTGRPLEEFKRDGVRVDLGDAESFALDGWLVVASFPGNAAIYRSKTRAT